MICREQGIDSYRVMELFCKDRRLNISSLYLKPGFAYGGPCLSKDLQAFIRLNKSKFPIPLLASTQGSNKMQKDRLAGLLLGFRRKKIGIIGLSFKQGTDDLRCSPILDVINKLIKHRCDITAFGGYINLSKLTGTNRAYLKKTAPYLRSIISNNFGKILRESDIIVVNHCAKKLIPRFKNLSASKIIVDLVGIKELAGKKKYIGFN
jgi:GDP-mannose 6-dehydrogenase